MAKKFRPNIKQVLLLIVLITTLSWNLFNIIATQKAIKKIKNELQRINASIVNVKKKQEEVSREIEKWKDPQMIEEVARKELGLVRPGETTYVFSESVQPATETEVTKRKSSVREGIGNWVDIVSLVGII